MCMFSCGVGGVQNFQRVQLLIPMATYKTCYSPVGEGPDPCPSLDPCMLLR